MRSKTQTCSASVPSSPPSYHARQIQILPPAADCFSCSILNVVYPRVLRSRGSSSRFYGLVRCFVLGLEWRRTVYPRRPARVFCFPRSQIPPTFEQRILCPPTMDKKRFIKELRITAEVLQPLTESTISGSFKWNGHEYAKVSCSKEEEKHPNPYALAWWSKLNTIASLIEAQQTPLSRQQLSYIESCLFQGMGSFSDLQFDPKEFGDIANIINDRLEVQRRDLYESLTAQDPSS